MQILVLAVALLQFGPGPAEKLLVELAGVKGGAAPSEIARFIDPVKGLEMDKAPEGASRPEWVKLTSDGGSELGKHLGPLFAAGIFKAAPRCEKRPEGYSCTVMTPTSLPQVVELSEVKGKLYLRKIYWAPDPGEEDDDEGLPL